MNKYEANRQAKSIFMAYGWQADCNWSDICALHDVDEADEELVYGYYVRCADRVHTWLGVK